jgi:hypothetical protein
MLRRDHLRDDEALEFIENGFRDDVIRFHVMDCAPCRSMLADMLVLIRGLRFKGGGQAALVQKQSPLLRDRRPSRPTRAFAPMKPDSQTIFSEPHVGSHQIRRFYSAAHEWGNAEPEFLDVAQHLMKCDVCLSQFLTLSRRLAPDTETMKKVLNTATALGPPSRKAIPRHKGKPLDVFDSLIDILRAKAADILELANRSTGTSASYISNSEPPASMDSISDIQFSEMRSYDVPAFMRKEPGEPFLLHSDARFDGREWGVVLTISGSATIPDPTVVSYELADAKGNILRVGRFDKAGELTVGADEPISEVKIFTKDAGMVFEVHFPDVRERGVLRQVEKAIAQLDVAIRRENELRKQLDAVSDRRTDAQKHLEQLLRDIGRIRRP